jgi:hypothetical protein
LWFDACCGKVSKTISQKTSQAWWSTSVIPATWEVEVGESQSEAIPGKWMRPYLKNNLKATGLRAWPK